VGTAGGEGKTEDVATEKSGVVTCGAITACRTPLSTRFESSCLVELVPTFL